MKISVKKTRPNVYSVSFGKTVHTLGTDDLKALVLESARALAPGILPAPSNDLEISALAARLLAAKDADLQEFIFHADESQILTLLKCTEESSAVHQKLFANMSERKHTILSEDLQYSFQDGITDAEKSQVIFLLTRLADKYNL